MDEALVLVALDFSGRGLLVYDVAVPSSRVGAFDTELVPEFLRALASNAGLTLHVKLMHGQNTHHIIEAIFKGLGRALGQAVAIDPRRPACPPPRGACSMLTIIDYGVGNLRSVEMAFRRLGIDPVVTSDPGRRLSGQARWCSRAWAPLATRWSDSATWA